MDENGGGGGHKETFESEGGSQRVVPTEAVLSERLNKDKDIFTDRGDN